MARELRVVIAGDTSRLHGAYGSATRDTSTFGSSITNVAGKALKGLAIGAGVAGVAVAVGMKKSLDAAGDFQSKMAVLQATTHGTNAQIAAASKLAIKLGADAKLPAVSAGDAADAMLQLGKAGFSVSKSMAAARGTLLLATAAETDGATSAKVITQNLNAFGLKAKDTGKIVDEMAGFMNATGTDFTAFADSLTYTAAISHTVGQSFADTTTQLTILSQAGIEGSQAGTGLRTMLAGLGAEGSKASKTFKAVGVDTVDSSGKFIGMRAVIAQLTPVFAKMTSSQRLTFLQTAFGKTAMNQANIVLGESVAKYDAAKAAVDRKGQADKLAASHMKGYKGAVAQLGSALETLQISMGTKLLPVATRVANFLTRLASAPNISVAIRIALSGIKSVAGDAKKAISDALFGSSKTITIGGEGRSTRVVMSQGIISQIQAFDWGKLLNGTSKAIVIGGEGRASRVVVSPGLLGSISTAFQDGMAKVNWKAVGITAGTAIGASITITTDGFDRFAQTAMAWANSHAGEIAGVGATIGLNVISKLLDPAFWLQHWQLIGGIAISVFPVSRFGVLGGKLAEAAFGKLGELFAPLILRALEKLPGPMGEAGLKIALLIGDGISKGVPYVTGKAVDLVEGVISAISRLGGRVAPLVRVAINTGVVAAIGGLIGAAAQKAQQLAVAIANAIKKAPGYLASLGGMLITQLASGIGSAASFAASAAADIGRNLGQGLVNGIEALGPAVLKAAEHLAKEALGPLKYLPGIHSPSTVTTGYGEMIGQGYADGMTNKAETAVAAAAKLVKRVLTTLNNAKSSVMSSASSLGDILGQGIDASATAAIALIQNGPLGQQLAALTKQITDNQNAEQLAQLNNDLDTAQAGGDPVAIQSAQQALDDWKLQQQQTLLQTQLQNAQDEINNEAAAKKTSLAQGLADFTDALNRGKISQATYNKDLRKLLRDSGQDYLTIGSELGSAFANGFLGAVSTLSRQITTIVGSTKIGVGPVISKGGKFPGFADGAYVKGGRGGVIARVGEGSSDELVLPLDSSSARSALGGGPVSVNVTINATTADASLGNVVIEAVTTALRRGSGPPSLKAAFGVRG